jgi:hypothetical protein
MRNARLGVMKKAMHLVAYALASAPFVSTQDLFRYIKEEGMQCSGADLLRDWPCAHAAWRQPLRIFV